MNVETLVKDLRQAVRIAFRQPGFTALVVLTLALGIGANSAVFALVDSVLLRPLPYREPARLVFLWQTRPSKNVFELEPTPFDFDAWHGLQTVSELGMVVTDAFTLSGDAVAERVRGARVTASLMPLLGIAPRIGRSFTPDEDAESASPVVILSDGLWRRRYGADPNIVGRDIRVDGELHLVIGVMPGATLLPGHLAASSDLWLPARMTPEQRRNPISHNYTVLGRLAPGVSIEASSREVDAFARRMASEHPDSHGILGARLVPVEEQTVRAIRPSLAVMGGGVVLLLFVASANVVSLLAARAAGRRHETAIRAALGATASRMLSLALAESLVQSALGGAAGLALATWTLKGIVPLFANSLPPSATTGIDARVGFFTAGLSALLAIALGLGGVLRAPRDLADGLRSGARTATGDRTADRQRSALVAAQVSLAVILLAAAGLMLSTVERLSRVNPGFDAEHVLSFRLSLTGSTHETAEQRMAFVNGLIGRLTASAGAEAAAVTSTIPFGGTRGADGVEIEGRPAARGEPMIIDQRNVTPDYFGAMRIPVLEGRGLRATDDAQAERVTVINRTMARKYWPNESPIDRRVRLTAGFGAHEWLRIVGVVGDVRHIALSREFVPEMYRPYAQAPVPAFTVVVRTAGEPAAITATARAIVSGIDAGVPMYDVRPMRDRIDGSFGQTRGTMILLVAVALLAVALAAVAVYGSIWYVVSRQMPEIAIRLALGATRASVCVDVVGRAVRLAAVGTAIGTAAALAGSSSVKGLLFETSPTNPATYIGAAGCILALAVAASLVPARRAMAVDPAAALRNS